MTLALVVVVGLGEVGSAAPLSLWSVCGVWALSGRQSSAVCGRAVLVLSGRECFAGVLACCSGGLSVGLKNLPSIAAASSYWGLLINCPNEVGFDFVPKSNCMGQ